MTKKTLADYTDTDALDPTKRLAEKYGGYPVRDDIPHINDDHGNEFLDPPRDEPWPEDEYPRRIGVWSIRDPSYPDLTKTAWYNTAVTSQQRDFPLEWVGASWHAHVRPARYFLLAHTSNGTDNEPRPCGSPSTTGTTRPSRPQSSSYRIIRPGTIIARSTRGRHQGP